MSHTPQADNESRKKEYKEGFVPYGESLSKRVLAAIILLKSSRNAKEQQANKDGQKDYVKT